MKRLSVVVAFVLASAILLAACGGSSSTAAPSGGGSSSGSGGSVQPGASGIKDPALLGKWITADGGSGYNFKDDFSVVISSVGSDTNSTYNIASGGNGSGKVEIGEDTGKVTWDYTITGSQISFTTPDGRARKMTKTQ